MKEKIEQLQRELKITVTLHKNQRKLFQSLEAMKGRIPDWTAAEIEAATRRMKLEVEKIEARRTALETKLVEALAALQVRKCMHCELMPIDDDIPICESCATACAREAMIGSMGRNIGS